MNTEWSKNPRVWNGQTFKLYWLGNIMCNNQQLLFSTTELPAIKESGILCLPGVLEQVRKYTVMPFQRNHLPVFRKIKAPWLLLAINFQKEKHRYLRICIQSCLQQHFDQLIHETKVCSKRSPGGLGHTQQGSLRHRPWAEFETLAGAAEEVLGQVGQTVAMKRTNAEDPQG